MKKLNKVAIVVAAAFAVVAPMSSVFAQDTTAPGRIDNWRNIDGNVWKNGTREYCWRDNFWTPATAMPECDGALKPVAVAVVAAPEPAPAPAAIAPVPSSEKVTYAADAFFDFDKAILKPEAKTKLDDLVSKTKEINLEVIIAVGHTDGVGTDAYNDKLSVRRAESIKAYLAYMPQNCAERPPVLPSTDPIDRADEELLDVIPESNRKPYDMYEVIRRIVDDGHYFDLKPQFARTIITCFARFGGRPAGIVANQPKHLGGILDNDSADKAARFVNLCDAFGIPLVFLVDVPGFMVGTKVEAAGIIRHGAKMLHAVAAATVPKVTVVIRKAYGAGYYVMNGRAYEPDLIVAWPSAEISVMGAEGAVEIIMRRQVEEADDPAAKKAELIDAYRKIIDVYIAAGNDMIDDVIDPRETRATICRALEMSAGKRVERPFKRSGVVPV